MRKSCLRFSSAVFFLPYLSCAFVWGGQGVPAGTKVQVRLTRQMDTESAKSGQTFSGTVSQPVVVNGKTVLARGAKVEGVVAEAVSSGRLKRPASITLKLTSPASEPLRIDGKSHLVRNAELIGGGAAAGALLGALAGGKKGAAVGAGVGAGAGTVTAYLTGKKEIVLPAETELPFVTSAGGGVARASSASRSERQARESTGAAQSYQGAGRQRGTSQESQASQGPMFSEHDQRLIRRYFEANTSNLPPGLAKRGGNLPPGLERQVERNGTLPPGLQKRVEPFPSTLGQQLPPLPAGCQRVILGARALILDRNNKILDLMSIR